jgi:hypothetical protein
MDISLTVLIGVAGLLAVVILAIAARVFFKVVKFLILAAILAVIAGFAWTQLNPRRETSPPISSTPAPHPRPKR